jgi:hypothetical protein
MREAPISGRYSLIDLLAYIIYEICHTNTPTSALQFGRVEQHAQRAGATVAMRTARGVGKGCEAIGQDE